ncbi:MAG: tetratricopeptide repeat protein, partial [Candidatus Zixiibacteriota bacterium]
TKLRLMINGFEIPNNQSTYFAREFSWIMKPLLFHDIIFFPYGILAPLAIVGMAFSFRYWRKYLLIYLVLISYTISLLLFFVCDRYRQPLIPFLIIFAVFGVVQIISLIKRKDKKNLILVFFVLSLLLIESNHMVAAIDPVRLQAEDHFIIGNAKMDMGNLSGAEIEYNKAIELDPLFGLPYNNLGMIAVRRGDINAASKHFLKAIQIDPLTIQPYMNYSTFLTERQQFQAALDVLLRASRVQPLNDFVHLKIGLTLYQLDRKEEALKSIEESIRLNPGNEDAKAAREQLLAELNKKSD